jgi:hypothetical protein
VGFVGDLITKNNPIAGTIRAGKDLASGNFSQAGRDFASGATYGTSNYLPGMNGGLVKQVDPTAALDAKKGYDTAAGGFAAERNQISPNGQLVQINPQYIDPLRQQQQGAIDMLRQAALGQAPSAAEIQGQNMANRAAAQQFGMASALGGRSPGAALNTALNGAAGIQGNEIANAMANRAQEQANARQQLVQGLQGVRGQEQDLGSTNANLNLNQQQMLLAAQLKEQGYSADMIKSILDAQSRNAAASNQMTGSLLGAGVSLLPLLSDRREKTDVKAADLESLADSLKGFRYRYKNEQNGAGERVGVMAQDALKGGPVGRRMVSLGGDGKLRMDVANSVGAALAMSAEALRRSRGKVA